jgi:hypothetical protein
VPAAPEGVSDLQFNEFFKNPVGPKGLELTPRLLESARFLINDLTEQVITLRSAG